MEKLGIFPAGVWLSPNRKVWRLSDIEKFKAERSTSRPAMPPELEGEVPASGDDGEEDEDAEPPGMRWRDLKESARADGTTGAPFEEFFDNRAAATRACDLVDATGKINSVAHHRENAGERNNGRRR
jgi:hypothetical protein